MKKRQSFLLMEILIGLFLAASLLGAIGFWQHRVSLRSLRNQKIYQLFSEESLVYKKLRAVFSTIYDEFSLSDEGNECSFVFNRGVYKNPFLSGRVKGRLFFQRDSGSLFLEVSSIQQPKILETICLLKQLQDVQFSLEHPVFQEKRGFPSTVLLHLEREKTQYTDKRNLLFTFMTGR